MGFSFILRNFHHDQRRRHRGLSMRYDDFLGSLSLASSHSWGFPYSVEHMAGEGQPTQAVRPNIVRVYGACAVC